MDTAHNSFLQPLRIKPTVPPIIYIVLVGIHLPAFYFPWLTSLPLIIRILLTAGVFISLGYHIFFGRAVKTAAVLDVAVLQQNDEWQIRLTNGETDTAFFGNQQFVQPWLVILELIQAKNRYLIFCTSNTMEQDQFRRLRTRILHRVEKQ